MSLEDRITELEALIGDTRLQYQQWLKKQDKEIAELREKVEGIYKSVHGIEPNDADTIWANLEINQNGIKRLNEQLNELKSGGENEPSECHSERMGVDSSEDNSKPPEPKPGEHFIMRDDNTPNNPILRALFFGGDDEYIIDWKFRYKRPYYEIVKREDLEWIIWNMRRDEMSLDGEERLDKIKEEYGIE